MTKRVPMITGGFRIAKPLPKIDNTKKVESDLNTMAFLLYINKCQSDVLLSCIKTIFNNKELRYFADVRKCLDSVIAANEALMAIYENLIYLGETDTDKSVSMILNEMRREVMPICELSIDETYENICKELSFVTDKEKNDAKVLVASTICRRMMYLALKHADAVFQRWDKDYPVIKEIFDPAQIQKAFIGLDYCFMYVSARIAKDTEITMPPRLAQIHKAMVGTLLDKELYISACRTLNIKE